MKFQLTVLAAFALAAPAFAEGDAAAGEAVFAKCQTCHSVIDADGNTLAGKGSKTGPNLYAIIGRPAGTYPEFKYGDDMIAAGAAGLIWDEAQIAVYVQDPSAFLKEILADKGAKGKMMFKLKGEADAANVAAYLASLSPAPAADAAAATTTP